MKKILEAIKGKKTYIIMVVGVILNGLIAMDVIPQSAFALVNSILGFLGLGAVRNGVNK